MESSSALHEPLLSRDLVDNNNDGCEYEEVPLGDNVNSSGDHSFSPASSAASSTTLPINNNNEDDEDDLHFNRVLKWAKRNVRRTLALTFFTFCSRSIWSQAPLSLFLAMAHPQHLEYVGYATAVMGMSQVVSSSLSKCLLRRYQLFNNKVLVLTSLIGILATFTTIKAVFLHSDDDTAQNTTSNLIWLMVAMALWGMAWGTSDSILPVVFMESASLSEHQERKFRRCSRLIKGGNFCGGTMALGIFYWLGNEWTLENCTVVMVIGLLLNLQVFFLLCSLRILPIEEDDDDFDYDEAFLDFEHDDNDNLHLESDALINNRETRDLEDQNEIYVSNRGEDTTENHRRCNCFKDAYAPLLISLADILSSFAGGMAIRYFPIFLAMQVGLQPVYLQVLFLVVPIGQWMSPYAARQLAKCSGPLRISILLQWTFVILMVSMVIGNAKGLSTWGVCILFALHGSLMNSTTSLTKMALLQHASEEDIHKWRVADKVQMVLWAWGAAVGGVVAGRYGIPITFFVTGAVQFLASIPLILLYFTSDNYAWIDWDRVDGDEEQSCVSNGSTFQDCLCDPQECGRSPATSDATSVTHSTDGEHSSSDSSYVSIPPL